MSTGLDRIEPDRFAAIGRRFSRWSGKSGVGKLAPKSILLRILLPAILVVGAGTWLLLPGKGGAANKPLQIVAVAAQPTPPPDVETANKILMFNAAMAEAIVPDAPAPLDKLTIASQSWRRGGLGSNALLTFTLRNNNAYAVKDIEIACAFTRQDGSHLTDRSRVIPDTVSMKSRKTFVRLHIGFVNVNASRAKCLPIAANRV